MSETKRQNKLKDLEGIKGAIEAIVAQAWEKGYKYGLLKGERSKWTITEIRCPNCLEYFQTDCYSKEELKKCPNCGDDMREG